MSDRAAEDYMDDYAGDDDGEDKYRCEGCGRGPYDDGQCPLCCPQGMYAPGTEECDWCEYSDECAEYAAGRF
jgi:hypothetical protein